MNGERVRGRRECSQKLEGPLQVWRVANDPSSGALVVRVNLTQSDCPIGWTNCCLSVERPPSAHLNSPVTKEQ